jgi:hypothetical protein
MLNIVDVVMAAREHHRSFMREEVRMLFSLVRL